MPDPIVSEIDSRTFWKMLGMRAVGAAVIAAAGPKGRAGFLALSATHLTADPPTMMASVGKSTSALETIQGSGGFAINYLSENQQDLAMIFSGRTPMKGEERFQSASWSSGQATGAPLLTDGAGWIECRLVDMIERFDTLIILGQVVSYAAVAEHRPLVSYAGGNFTLGQKI